jgi:type III pantothenate kinase
MLFCIDIGNTNIVLGVSEKNRILYHWRIRTEKEVTPDELGILVTNLFQSVGARLEDIKDIILSCVVPPLLNTFEEFSRRYFNVSPMVVGPDLNTGMPIHMDNPQEVGADRIVNAVGAYEKYRTALIAVDFGTATTFDYISQDGAYMGGAIAPGVVISCEALFHHASKLPRVEIFARPKSVIGKNTISGMNVNECRYCVWVRRISRWHRQQDEGRGWAGLNRRCHRRPCTTYLRCLQNYRSRRRVLNPAGVNDYF